MALLSGQPCQPVEAAVTLREDRSCSRPRRTGTPSGQRHAPGAPRILPWVRIPTSSPLLSQGHPPAHLPHKSCRFAPKLTVTRAREIHPPTPGVTVQSTPGQGTCLGPEGPQQVLPPPDPTHRGVSIATCPHNPVRQHNRRVSHVIGTRTVKPWPGHARPCVAPTLGPVWPGIPLAPSLPARPWDTGGKGSAPSGGFREADDSAQPGRPDPESGCWTPPGGSAPGPRRWGRPAGATPHAPLCREVMA